MTSSPDHPQKQTFRPPLFSKRGGGTYILVLHLNQTARISIGKLGTTRFPHGYYTYVGSALGPGGLESRVGRHCKVGKPCRWHIDYLRRKCRLVDVWFIRSNVRREHDWATILAATHEATIPMNGFGSSDCRCSSHLFHFPGKPSFPAFQKKIDLQFPQDPTIRRVSGVH